MMAHRSLPPVSGRGEAVLPDASLREFCVHDARHGIAARHAGPAQRLGHASLHPRLKSPCTLCGTNGGTVSYRGCAWALAI